MSVRINHLIKRLDAAGFQYQTTHMKKAYLTELDECAKMPGAEKITLSKMPAKDYLTILKIRTLREPDGQLKQALCWKRPGQKSQMTGRDSY